MCCHNFEPDLTEAEANFMVLWLIQNQRQTAEKLLEENENSSKTCIFSMRKMTVTAPFMARDLLSADFLEQAVFTAKTVHLSGGHANFIRKKNFQTLDFPTDNIQKIWQKNSGGSSSCNERHNGAGNGSQPRKQKHRASAENSSKKNSAHIFSSQMLRKCLTNVLIFASCKKTPENFFCF